MEEAFRVANILSNGPQVAIKYTRRALNQVYLFFNNSG